MGNVIGVIGESGSGKTTAMRNLPPDETFYIDADKKGLNWKGWSTQYSTERKNYVKTDGFATIWHQIRRDRHAQRHDGRGGNENPRHAGR